jgi:hypothetical protein
VLVASYTFLDVFWSMLVFFVWVMWFMLLFRIWGDIFSRSDLSGGGKTGWLVFTILVPFLGVFVYVIKENDGMNQRALDRARAQQSQMDDYVRSTAGGGAAADIEKAKQLLDSGAITQAEFDTMKAKALA